MVTFSVAPGEVSAYPQTCRYKTAGHFGFLQAADSIALWVERVASDSAIVHTYMDHSAEGHSKVLTDCTIDIHIHHFASEGRNLYLLHSCA